MSHTKCWLKFIDVKHDAGDRFIATFEVDGVAQVHEVEVTEYCGIHGVSGTTFFAMTDRGWDSFEEKKLIQTEISKMAHAALSMPRMQ